VGYDPSVQVRHAWGASTRQEPRKSRKLHAAAMKRYFGKHFPRATVQNRVLFLALALHRRLGPLGPRGRAPW
jgi:hypothetical protein